MNLQMLKEQVLVANLDLPRHGLVTFTWGNVSGIDREQGLVVIKPSGVSYERMRVEDMVVLDLAGKQVEGALRPSSDTATHLVLYRTYPELGGVVHTHSTHATAWAQAGRPIPIFGTTQADYFHGEIPCSRLLTPGEVEEDYEGLTGHLIVETLKQTPSSPCRGCWWPTTAPSAGARVPKTRCTTPWCWRRWRAWPGSPAR